MEVTRREFLQLGATSTGVLGISPLGFKLDKPTQVKQQLHELQAQQTRELAAGE